MSDQGPPRDPKAVVRTHPVRVRVYARNGAVITGLAHIKPGAYQRRVSDVLNLGQVQYIAITEVSYGFNETGEQETECVLVNVDDIVMVDVSPPRPGDEDKREPELPGASL
ncbi:MAG: hypothetical protein R3343_10630 [Nitriliruptorales bacterium]|nr:hypothetical protein [Nitriliruptorales bacterium]